MKPVYVLNGPNLNLLGRREPATYGHVTLAEIETEMRKAATAAGFELIFRQSSQEGDLVDWVHEAGTRGAPIILNAGAYTHTSIALHDAIRAADAHVIEVHLSNIHAREAFRHHSFISAVAQGIIAGFGARSYLLALDALASNPPR
jgi:3-dehydroquinate dehydratase-2